ncbi:MAG: flagellar filament capping protein FliD [Oligoflexia bacterium]|nr:flagellar filament capping protein FliD [Oligoflexia bacterium]
MAISFGSINTGLPKDIVKQILVAERVPITKMEDRKARLEEKSKLVTELIKLFEDLLGDLRKNSSAKTLRELKATYDKDLVDVTIDPETAEPGEYRFEIDQLAQKSSIMTTGFEDPDESYVGVGYVQYTLPSGETKDIYVDSDNASLRGVAKLINRDPLCGMRATVVNDGSGDENPWRLLIALNRTGDDYVADFPYFYFVDGEDDLEIDEEREAHDAIVKLDGFQVEVPNNTTSDLISGLTIDLKKARPGDEFSIKISEDREAIVGKVSAMVEKINKILQFINTQNQLDAKSDTTRTLGGDVTLQTVESRIRSLMFEPLTVVGEDDEGGSWFESRRIGDLGISFQRNGLLAFDDKKFGAFLSKDFKQVFQMLVGFWNSETDGKESGFVNKLENLTSMVVKKPEGILTNRKQGIRTTMDQIDRQIENRERIISKKESMLKDKFARLEETISRLKAQGAGLASMQGAPDVVPKLGESQ